jgi:hypothetical protein
MDSEIIYKDESYKIVGFDRAIVLFVWFAWFAV